MAHRCKHCATSYTDGTGVDGFCCAGCAQVYLLIQQEGLEDYYRLQDRVAQPLKDRALSGIDVTALESSQASVEAGTDSGQAVFEIEGMSCMGCAWLVERLARGQAGTIRAVASLSQHSLCLQWRRSDFDLAELGAELFRFGYRINAEPIDSRAVLRFSPLAFRFVLTLVFSGNALLLAAYEQFGTSAEEERLVLLSLLSLICVAFTMLLGAAPFFQSASRAIQIRRWHSDWVPVMLIVASSVFVAYECIFSQRIMLSFASFLISALVTILIGARWLGTMISKR